MAVFAGNNSQVDNAKTMAELARIAVLEQAGDRLLWIKQIGRSAVLAANVEEDVWAGGGIRALPYTAGEILSIASNSTADELGGTGANYIQVNGLDIDYNLVTETIIMNGTTPVLTTGRFITVIRSRVILSGTGKKNAGIISVTGVTSTNLHCRITALNSISQSSHITVPAGYTLYTMDTAISVFRSAGANATRGAEVDVHVYVPDANTQFDTIKIGISSIAPYVGPSNLVANTPAKSTVWYSAVADTNNTIVTTSISYLLVKGDYNLRTEI